MIRFSNPDRRIAIDSLFLLLYYKSLFVLFSEPQKFKGMLTYAILDRPGPVDRPGPASKELEQFLSPYIAFLQNFERSKRLIFCISNDKEIV